MSDEEEVSRVLSRLAYTLVIKNKPKVDIELEFETGTITLELGLKSPDDLPALALALHGDS